MLVTRVVSVLVWKLLMSAGLVWINLECIRVAFLAVLDLDITKAVSI